MNSKSTFWLMMVALGLGGYIFLLERHTLNTDERAQQAAKLFPDFDPAKVASVEILRSNNVKFIRAERANDQWRLVQPAYPAQSTAIDNWLGLFRSLDRRTYLSALDLLAQPGGLTAFGLDSPQATVMIQQLQTARVDQFISDTPGSDLEPYGLRTTEVTLVFSQGADRVLTVEFGKSPTNQPGEVFARRSNYPAMVVTVPKHLVDLLRAPY